MTEANNWIRIQQLYTNSILQLVTTKAEHNIFRPYRPPRDSTSHATGFIIDKEGTILTNAHVIDNAMNMIAFSPLLGKRVIEIMPLTSLTEKDCGLCKI